MNKKIISVGIIILIVGLSFSSVNAQKSLEEKKGIFLKLSEIKSDGTIFNKNIFVKEKDIDELRDILEKTLNRAIEQKNDSILDILLNFIKDKFPYLYEIIDTIIEKIKFRRSRTTIYSFGQGYKFNPFRKSLVSFSLKNKKSGFFHYSKDSKIKGRTYLEYPYGAKPIIITGRQFGHIRNFVGLYVYFAQKIPKQSFTFFVGKAESAFAFRIPSILDK